MPDQVSVAQRLRAADALHERKKLERKARVEREWESDPVVDAMFADPPPELVSAVDAECESIELMFGPAFDALLDSERDDFAREALSEYAYGQFRRGLDALFRDELLRAFRESKVPCKSSA